MKERMKEILKIFLVVLLLAAYGWFALYSQWQEGRYLRTQELQMQDSNNALQARIGEIRQKESQLPVLEEEVELLQSKLNHDLSDGAFLVKLLEKIRQENTILASYKMGDVVDLGKVYALPLEMKMAGDYRSVMGILNYLEYQPNLTQVQKLRLEVPGEEQLAAYYGTREELGTRTEWVLVERDPATVLPGESPFEELLITRIAEVDLREMFKGTVEAELLVVLYTVPTPEAKIQLENIRRWDLGSGNPFLQR